jgi:hypothetical protein
MKQVNNIKKIYGSCCAGQRVKKILREEDVQNVSPCTCHKKQGIKFQNTEILFSPCATEEIEGLGGMIKCTNIFQKTSD